MSVEVTCNRLMYVAGPIKGTTDFHARFKQGMQEVIQLGYTPVSPLDVATVPTDCTWEELTREQRKAILVADARALMACDGIYLMRGWENSVGARWEKGIADGLDMTVLYQTEKGQQ